MGDGMLVELNMPSARLRRVTACHRGFVAELAQRNTARGASGAGITQLEGVA
jgi:hypothetical protein